MHYPHITIPQVTYKCDQGCMDIKSQLETHFLHCPHHLPANLLLKKERLEVRQSFTKNIESKDHFLRREYIWSFIPLSPDLDDTTV